MDLDAVINSTADEADGFLAGVRSMTEARPLIREYLKQSFPKLGPEEAPRVVAGVLAILDDEEFFAASGGDEVLG